MAGSGHPAGKEPLGPCQIRLSIQSRHLHFYWSELAVVTEPTWARLYARLIAGLSNPKIELNQGGRHTAHCG